MEDLHIHNMHQRIHWIGMRHLEEYGVGRVENFMECIIDHNQKQAHIFISPATAPFDKPLIATLAAGSELLNLKAGFRCRGIQTSYENDGEVINRKRCHRMQPV
ncbi:hypothetical protein PIB30_076930 [Stylosanthes scabra]|uniref:Uncharacterized protein n=1 Tax=Stylosanthes scabra TaxID=79078 RepID=A0ABU6QR21_9FABA|nr:hypothetical protein [Stylosanthes scabra]